MKHLVVFLLILAAATAVAQMPMPKPGPELKKLDYFIGNWKSDGEMKPGPFGPGGKMAMTEKVSWMDGNFFAVINSNYDAGTMGKGTGVAYMGYNTEDKVYTYDEYNSQGEAEHSKGTVEGDTWTWTSDDKMNGMAFKSRFTMKILSPTAYTFKFEMSQDGTTWNTMMEGKAVKQ